MNEIVQKVLDSQAKVDLKIEKCSLNLEKLIVEKNKLDKEIEKAKRNLLVNY